MSQRPFDYWLLWIVALGSLAVNAWLVRLLADVRRQAGEGAVSAAQAVGDLRQSSIDYQVHVEQSLPVTLSVPISETLSVPISATLPVNTQVTIPLKTPLGTFPITIPIQTTVPVNLQPKVPIRLTVPVSTTVPVVLDVPIQIQIADTALGDSLAAAQHSLETLAVQWGAFPAEPFEP